MAVHYGLSIAPDAANFSSRLVWEVGVKQCRVWLRVVPITVGNAEEV